MYEFINIGILCISSTKGGKVYPELDFTTMDVERNGENTTKGKEVRILLFIGLKTIL